MRCFHLLLYLFFFNCLYHTMGVLFICIMLCVFSMSASAQPAADKALLGRFDRRFAELDSLIFRSGGSTALPELPKPAGGGGNKVFPTDSLIRQKTREEILALKGETGLQLTGQAYYRPSGGFGQDEDDAVSRYDGKFQAELRWYFFQSSLFRRHDKTEEIRLTGEIERLKSRSAQNALSADIYRNAFRHTHDSLMYAVLSQRADNLTLIAETQAYLLAKGNISSDELLGTMNEKAEAERTLAAIPGHYRTSRSLPASEGIVIHIDSAGFMQEVQARHSGLTLMQLEMQLKEHQIRNAGYWNDFRLAPFVRYSHYTRTARPNSSNIDAGISFTVPIAWNSGKSRRAMQTERKILENEKAVMAEQIGNDVIAAIGELEKCNRLIEGETARGRKLKGYIADRQDAYSESIGEYSRITRLKEYDTYLLCMENLLGYIYRRDMQLAMLQSFLPDIPIERFCTFTFIP